VYSILTREESQPDQFVDFWSSFYTYPSEDLYLDNISKASFSSNDLRNLFVWKNGMRLSGQKDAALQSKILRNLRKVNELKTNFLLEEFNNTFSSLPTIWKIFLLHCIQPQIYPIFDQHVYRAMHCVENGTILEVPKSERQKYRQYFDSYVSFFNRVVQQSNRSYIKVDRALWSFGKSLRSPLVRRILSGA
jgi:hypothetical protein